MSPKVDFALFCHERKNFQIGRRSRIIRGLDHILYSSFRFQDLISNISSNEKFSIFRKKEILLSHQRILLFHVIVS